jgi:hypothetical protein
MRPSLAVALLMVALAWGCGSSDNDSNGMPPLGSTPDCAEQRATFAAGLPVPTPTPGRYVVQLVNESNVTVLLGANAAHVAGKTPKPVMPREGDWVMQPGDHRTIDIPPEWESTIPSGSIGPVFWARTGCRYDIAHNLAQCETGDCGGVYDCSEKGLTPPGPKSLAEWTFRDANGNAAPDISVVDGVNLNMDIEPLGKFSKNTIPPVAANFWLGPANLPLTECGGDLRANCPEPFQLRRTQLTFFIQGTAGADDVVGCFSNCGQYKFQGQLTGACVEPYRCPGEPPEDCDESDPICHNWKAFCCAVPIGDPDHIYGRMCTSNTDCPQEGSCWNNIPPGAPPMPSTCACRGFIKQATCPPDVCTNQYTPTNPDLQPPFGHCTDVTPDADACIGDDTFHEVMPRGLTWPNDPETYYSDAVAFRITFAPGGTTVPITDSGPIPGCSTMPAEYDYAQALVDCSDEINKGAQFGGARLPSVPPHNWDCNIADGTAVTSTLCRWDPVPIPTPTPLP